MQKKVSRRAAGIAVLAASMGWTPAASSQPYPSKHVRIVVGYAPGGGTDVTARLVAQKLSDQFGQSVVVENRTGAAATIAAERVAASPPDGYTLLMMAAADSAQPSLRKLTYDLQRDLAPITRVVQGPAYVLVVHPALPARNAIELARLARAQPGQVNFASSGVGSQAHLAGALFGRAPMAAAREARLNLESRSRSRSRRGREGPSGSQVDVSQRENVASS